jgi:hypothetical protein
MRPVFMDGRFFFLDKIKKNKPKVKPRILPTTTKETCNKAPVYKEPHPSQRQGRQLLLIVSDPGLPVIIAGLTLILTLMVGYFLIRLKPAHSDVNQ